MPYILQNGDEATKEQIQAAFSAGHAVIVHNHGDNHTKSGLMIDGKHMDTRGECYSVWDEVWTSRPQSIQECYQVARLA